MNMNELTKILQESWNFFKANIVGICSIIMPFVVPLGIFYALIEFFNKDGMESVTWLAFLGGMALYPIYQGALILYMASVVTGEYLEKMQYYKLASRFWLPLVTVYFVSSLAVMAGFLLLIVPGLIVLGRVAFSEFYCAFHNRSGMEAYSDSWKATKKDQWLLVSGIVIIHACTSIPILGIEYVLKAAGLLNPIFTFIIGTLSSLLSALMTIFAFRVYTLDPERLNRVAGGNARRMSNRLREADTRPLFYTNPPQSPFAKEGS